MKALPIATPDTTPDALTDAMDELLLDHVPPGVVSDIVTVEPWHTNAEPLIGVGSGLTVSVATAAQPVDNV
jgi:hypothetical protein